MKEKVDEITRFIWAHQPLQRSKGYDWLRRWVDWHASLGFVATTRDDNDELVGAAVFRLIMDPMDAFEPYKYDMEGRGYYISEMVCTAKDAMKVLGLGILSQYGQREFICWQKSPDYKLYVHPISVFRRNLFRASYAT